MLHMIIEKWLRIVTGMSASFNETDNDEMEINAIRRVFGNAVPPVLAEALYRAVLAA